mmetsp:Transcript_41049/g.117106  ORF Transcript_41049/g.117106 Transcript_41049/m.117106 type:complete len:232 (+) Transcript_41049:95-790(+)
MGSQITFAQCCTGEAKYSASRCRALRGADASSALARVFAGLITGRRGSPGNIGSFACATAAAASAPPCAEAAVCSAAAPTAPPQTWRWMALGANVTAGWPPERRAGGGERAAGAAADGAVAGTLAPATGLRLAGAVASPRARLCWSVSTALVCCRSACAPSFSMVASLRSLRACTSSCSFATQAAWELRCSRASWALSASACARSSRSSRALRFAAAAASRSRAERASFCC